MSEEPLGAAGGQSSLLRFVDIEEQYGSHIIDSMLSSIHQADSVLDLGAGYGRDLDITQNVFPNIERHAVEFDQNDCKTLSEKGIKSYQVDLENTPLPFENESFDIVIANQVLEHLKDIFFTLHETARVLKTGGHFLIGVPNVTAFHNRLLMLLGRHPTQVKSYSAHVRAFSYHDTKKMLETAGGGAFSISSFGGAQFYPLPKKAARMASALFPQMSVTIFFLLKKEQEYTDSFFRYGRSLTASVFCRHDNIGFSKN